MILWLRVRRAWLLLLAAVLVAVLSRWAAGASFAMPALVGSTSSIMWTTLVLLLWGVAVADAFSTSTLAVEARPSVRVARHDAALFVVATGVAAGGLVVTGGASGPALGAVARLVIISGLACAVTRRFGPGAATLTCAVLLVGSAPYGPSAWAGDYVRVLHPDGNQATAVVLAVALGGLALWMLLTRRVAVRLGSSVRLADA
ncbi:hypothetical protein [Nocardioides jishulii]|uniref:Uncharacterized protein n=1 Tax=Nocardioides jishulii TaxID=2575440 RepID=A0A4U2YR31_9ACTN|nr:hypothetical protein [Nocardioides jishulii]QCX26328.1 hypothetical protein FCL41_01295 [Nocardioides jishulii]TKI63867.1 hypothetical protein FC770_01410 [Nocardioides jishulii]